MSIRATLTFCCILVFLVGIAASQQSSKPQPSSDPPTAKTAVFDIDNLSVGRTASCAGKKTGCCLDSSICSDKQYCDDNCQCTRKKPAVILQDARAQPAAISSSKETRTEETAVSSLK